MWRRVVGVFATVAAAIMLGWAPGIGTLSAAPAIPGLEQNEDVDVSVRHCPFSSAAPASVERLVELAISSEFDASKPPNRQARRDQNIGLAIGVIIGDRAASKSAKVQTFFYGETVKRNNTRPKGDTYFNIGSVSKLFVATLLGVYNSQGLLKPPLPSPPGDLKMGPLLQSILPPEFRLPFPRDEITLVEMATHHSGFPRRAQIANRTGDKEEDVLNMYRAFTSVNLEGVCVTTCSDEAGKICPCSDKCQRCPCIPPGLEGPEGYQYSNTAFHVLGHALAQAARQSSWAEANRHEITGPLGLTSTDVKTKLTDQACLKGACRYSKYECSYKDSCNGTFSTRAAVGYEVDDCGFARRSKHQGFDTPAVAPGGDLWSTTDDLVRFIKYNLGLVDPGDPRKPTPQMLAILPDIQGERAKAFGDHDVSGGVALGWRINQLEGNKSPTFLWKDGSSPGFKAYVAFVPSENTGIVVLTNSTLGLSVGSIGKQILNWLHSDCVAR